MKTLDPSAPQGHRRDGDQLAEVWGDVVDLRHLGLAVAIGAVVSLGVYVVAGRLFAAVIASAEVGRSYAMLVGLLGCVASGALSARLFAPKRVMTELAGELVEPSPPDQPGRGAATDVPAEVADEMRALGLRDAFAGDAL